LRGTLPPAERARQVIRINGAMTFHWERRFHPKTHKVHKGTNGKI